MELPAEATVLVVKHFLHLLWGARPMSSQHGIEHGEQLQHAGGQSHLGRFARNTKPLIELAEDRILSASH